MQKLAVLLAVLAAALALNDVNATSYYGVENCSVYTTCADCACGMTDYAVNNVCTMGCAWVPESGECMSPEAARSAGDYFITQLFTGASASGDDDNFSTQRERQAAVDSGNVQCPLVYGSGTGATMGAFMGLGAALMVAIAAHQIRFCCVNTKNTTWLQKLVRDNTPRGDRLQWQGESRVWRAAGCCGYATMHIVAFCMLMLPSIVWLCIGVPVTISANWSFNFFFPICFVGGMGALFAIITLIALCAGPQAQVRGYALTDKHIVIVTADPRKKSISTSGSVTSHSIGRISTVTRRGDVVTFASVAPGSNPTSAFYNPVGTAAPGAAAAASQPSVLVPIKTIGGITTIRLGRLKDADTVFDILQNRASGIETYQTPATTDALPIADGSTVIGMPVESSSWPVEAVKKGKGPYEALV